MRLASSVLFVAVVCAGSASLPPRAASPQNPWALRITSVASPAPPNSAQPHLGASPRGVLLSWIERDGARASLRFAERTPTGWTAPRTVASGENWFVNWADVPSVIRLPGAAIVGHWLEKSGPGTYAYDVRLAYSTDDGRTFSPSFLPHHDATRTEHGFASLFPMNGGFGLVWLDGRETRPEGQMSMDHQGGGAMTLRYAAFDRAWKQTADVAIDSRVCECCPTSVAVTADGPIVAYRNRSDQEIRDIHVSRFEQGRWSESKAVADDNWHITGCPVNGPSLSARGRDVALAWFTGKESQIRAFVAFSRDTGRTFGAPVRVDDGGTLGRVDAELLDDGSVIVGWIEYVDRVAEFRVRRIETSGARSAAVVVAKVSSDRTSGYPRLARHGHELVMAWIESTPAAPPAQAPQLQVRTAVAQIPSGVR